MASTGLPTADRLMRKATAYLARRSASTAQVRGVLERALRRAAFAAGDDIEPLDDDAIAQRVAPVLERLGRAGLLDDAAFARMKVGSLAAKGKPASLIRADLKHRYGVAVEQAGIDDSLAALDPAAQARRWAQRRRLGPFRLRDRAERRDRDIASLVRAGFSVGLAKAVIDGPRDDEAEGHEGA